MQECKFKVGDVVKRVEWIDSYSNKPNIGEPWKISGIGYEEGEWFLCFEGDTYGIEWEAERFALVSRAEEQHTRPFLNGESFCGPRAECNFEARLMNTNESVVHKGENVVSAEQKQNKYSREIKPNVFIDVYDVLRAFEVTDPCLSHLAKKALCAGLRGHKDRLQDLEDIKASIERAIEMHKEWGQ